MMQSIFTIVVIIIILIVLFKVFKLILRLVLVAVFLLICYFTNPTLEQHEEAVTLKAQKDNTTMTGKTIVVDDYKIFSLTTIQEESEKRVIGAGLLTKVWVFGHP